MCIRFTVLCCAKVFSSKRNFSIFMYSHLSEFLKYMVGEESQIWIQTMLDKWDVEGCVPFNKTIPFGGSRCCHLFHCV